MKVTILGSGSGGNSILVEGGGTRILVDAGFSGREIERRLAVVGVEPESIEGIVITHDHGDHTHGTGVLARRFGLPLYLTELTRDACRRLLRGDEEIRLYHSSKPFSIGPLNVHPFLTLHDAVDPVAISISDEESGTKLGIATDLGRPTASVRHALSHSDLLILEANHDEAMLWNAPYPWSVKQRIASSHGHLSNNVAADLVRELFHPEMRGVVLAHLSEAANDPELAREVVGLALEEVSYRGRLLVAGQDEPLETIDIPSLRETTRYHEADPQLSLL